MLYSPSDDRLRPLRETVIFFVGARESWRDYSFTAVLATRVDTGPLMKTPSQGLDWDLPMEKFADPAGTFCKRQ
ncbi:hypothetical protein SBDP2_680013 [Syntrophobacter sp. SbD2]|nr:hypothetical protein SBDP2_680013 [Syntrophobacter sp. SbD2]